MSAPRIRIETADLEKLLEEFKERLDFRGALGKRIASIMREDALRQFQAGGIPAWPPLAQSTIEQKQKLGYPRLTRRGMAPTSMMQQGRFGPANILERTGALLSSWTDAQDPHHVEEITKDSVSTGTDLSYAPFHQSDEPRDKIPHRPIRITEGARARIVEAIQDHVTGES